MIPLRSLLFVPADSPRKLARAEEAGADALILDLEDSVADASKPAAREAAAAFLSARPAARRTSRLWVRINPLDGQAALADLAAIVGGAPDGVVLPKCGGPEDARRLSHYLDALEVRAGLAPGAIAVLPVATETAAAPFRLGDYAGAGLDRLLGLSWGAEDLAAALGATTNLDEHGGWAATYRLVRALTLLGARAAGVQPLDTVFVDYRDERGLRVASRSSRAEGFTGRLAIHPAQVPIINESYLPSAAEVEQAQGIVAAFAAAPDAGVVGLDGRMLDRPHLVQAEATLALAAAYRDSPES